MSYTINLAEKAAVSNESVVGEVIQFCQSENEDKKRGNNRERANGEGSVWKDENGIWRGRIMLGTNPYTGKPVRIRVSGNKQKEVLDKMAKAKADFNGGKFQMKNDITVEEWVNYWLENNRKEVLEKGSYINYCHNFKNHILPLFGDYRLQDLTSDIIQAKYTSHFKQTIYKPKTGEVIKYSQQTLNYVAGKFRLCLRAAVDNKILLENPHNNVTLCKLREPKDVEAFDLDDHKKLVEHCKKNPFDYLFLFLLGTGVRIGEACGLQWHQVDLDNGTVFINQTMIEISGNPKIQNKTKTKAGERYLHLPKSITDMLKEIKDNQDKTQNPYNLVFPSKTGNFKTTANLRRRWAIVCRDAGVAYKNPHACRHTWATRAIEKRIPITTISRMLGHARIATTMSIYVTALKKHQQDAAEVMEEFL